MEFPKALKAAREKHGLSQAEMAVKLGVSAGTYADWELGTHKARLDRVDVIAEVLGRDVARALVRQTLGEKAARFR